MLNAIRVTVVLMKLHVFQFGLAPYLLPIYNILTKLANPMIEVAISFSQSTNYHNPSYVTAGFMAGLISVAIVGTKMKAY